MQTVNDVLQGTNHQSARIHDCKRRRRRRCRPPDSKPRRPVCEKAPFLSPAASQVSRRPSPSVCPCGSPPSPRCVRPAIAIAAAAVSAASLRAASAGSPLRMMLLVVAMVCIWVECGSGCCCGCVAQLSASSPFVVCWRVCVQVPTPSPPSLHDDPRPPHLCHPRGRRRQHPPPRRGNAPYVVRSVRVFFA